MIHGPSERIGFSVVDAPPEWPDSAWALIGPEYPKNQCIHEIFEAHVVRAPNAVAVVFEDASLSYGELNRRANQLAHHLRDLGAGTEVPVALFLERSLDLAVAVLALLKAGSVSVPLGPAIPPERIAFMMEDAAARLVLTETRLAHLLPPVNARVVCLDEQKDRIARRADTNPAGGVVADNLCAYVYTSGSTGTPKAVMITHRIASRIQWSHVNAVKLDHTDRTLVTSSVEFGFFLGEFCSGLMRGATAVLARPGGYHDIDYLVDVVDRHRITVISFVPTVLRLFLARLKERGLARAASLRHIVSQGEALTEDLQEDLRTSLPAQVHKFYGLTEAPVAAYWDCLEKGPLGKVTIGRPTNMEFRVLDERLKPVRIGEPGEIYLSGVGLARGYLKRPGLTAERFVANPFSSQPGSRLFRTGDTARWLIEGTLEFLGRVDQQVKIRGVRIDVGEIEAVLRAHPQIDEAVVASWRDAGGTDRLVAYFVADSADAPSVPSLREFLGEKLPEGSVPSALIRLDQLPLLANGKVDRKALPSPTRQLAVYRAARTPEEEILCGVFTEILGVPRVGIDDHFFELGGHSLMATRLVSRVRASLGVELAIRSVFEAPTVVALAARLRQGEKARAPLVRERRPERLPLSFAQARLWFLDRLEGPGPTYNIPLAVRLEGEFDQEALESALGDLVARHESLRTIFPEEGGAPFQEILPAAEARPSLVVEEVTEGELADRMTAAAGTGINLSQELPLRAWLFRIEPRRHVLLLVLHHIAGDGWSLGPLTRDLAWAYAARSRGEPPVFGELPVQYADYTLWQRGLLGEEGDADSPLARQLGFWRKALAGVPEELDLPADHPRPSVASYRGSSVPVRMDAGLHRRLLDLARSGGASLFMVMQAGLAALLCRLGAGEDITIGSPVAGRGEQALEELVGFFVNTLVLRTDVSGDPSFRELIQRVRGFDLEAYDHQDVPFERIVEALQPARSLARHPLFQVMLEWRDLPEVGASLPGLAMDFDSILLSVAKFDVTVGLRERFSPAGEPLGIEGELEYSHDLFEEKTAQAMAARLVRLLTAAVESPDLPLHELEILDTAERHTLLQAYNSTSRAVRESTLVELFEAQVARAPDAVALIVDDQELSYGELNARSNRLAHHLISLGVGPESVVGVCLERSAEMVVALLATLKAGGAYLPLDPDYPNARLDQITADATPEWVLATALLQNRLVTTNVLPLDSPVTRAALATASAQNPNDQDRASPLTAQHPAYIIFTSGSTGAPKGVVMPHSTIVNLMTWHQQAVVEGRVAQFTSISFDVSVQEILYSLFSGSALVVVDNETRLQPERLAAFLRRQGVTDLFVPNIVLECLVKAAMDDEVDLRELRNVYQAGEALTVTPTLRSFFERHHSCRLHNHYGPAETHVVTTQVLASDSQTWPYRPSIGVPIANARAYVLDEWLEPVPPGTTGELYVGGGVLARGYLNRPVLTAERFVADPYSHEPGSRMYRTGDRARWRSDGTLEFLGRIDQQVKIRGFRIEPGEIESVLARHPTVSQAAVVARDDGPAGKCLVAYIVPTVGSKPGVSELRRFLAALLPEYMVPAGFVVLGALPLTTNGKLDRRALPKPERLGEAYRAARTPEEEILCGVFTEILGVPRVGIDDHFFELGGHSLMATRLVSRVRASLGVELAIRSVFEAPTVVALAARLRQGEKARAPLVRERRPERLPLSFAQARLWFLDRLEGPGPTYNIPLAVRLEGEFDQEALESALGDLVARHESLRTIFPEEGGAPFQEILPAAEARPSLVVEEVTEGELADRMTAAAGTGINLSQELPLRAWLFRIEPRRHVLLLVLHHIAGDGWSLGPLTRDLAWAYAARSRGEPPVFGELPVQYADYTLWQRGLLGEEGDADSPLARQLGFWRKALAGVPEELDLPADHPRPSVASYRGSSVPVRMDAGLHRRLLDLARSGGASLFMVMQAGLAALLCRLGAGEDITIGSPVAGRGEQALEELVGFFVNTLVLRTDVSGDPSFRELIQRVRGFDLEAYDHQDVPFERIVEALQPARSLARHPLFQVGLVLQNAPAPDLVLCGLTVRPEPLTSCVAKFDVTIGLRECIGPDGPPGGIEGWLEYSRDLFEEKTAQAMAARLVRLLTAAVESPDLPLHELEVLDAAERHTLLQAYNSTSRAVRESTLVELFEAQVARAPDAVALIVDDQELSYGELNARSNRLAHHLISLGVGPESVVGVCLERSTEMVVALLATLKAGGAYLPLDPNYPSERIAFMLHEAPGLVLATTTLGGRLHAATAVLVLDSAEVRGALGHAPSHDPTDRDRTVPLRSSNPAYIIYTSGSTGMPKGVIVTHAGIPTLATAQVERLGITPRARVLQFASLNFDASLSEIAMALSAGAALVLAPDEPRAGPLLRQWIIAQRITHATLPPIVLATLAESDGLPLEGLIVAGEACPGELAARWSSGRRLINAYGPTETTVCATMSAPLSGSQPPPIGSPIWNMRVYVLDAWLGLAPLRVTGELYVAGAGLARGYLNRPGLTAERFVADPYSHQPGSRMYRTGDKARWRSDGTLEFLGRADQQVKIRGFRIEPGEIESALTKHPTIAQAAVVARDDGPTSKRLVAYVIPAAGAAPETTALRHYLATLLPDYMVPAAFCILERLPLTSSGKLNHRALPDPAGTRPDLDASFTPARSRAEELMAGIWCELLGLDRVGIRDDFFELGGHSLLVLKLWARVKESFGQEYPLKLFFRNRTIEQLTAMLDKPEYATLPHSLPGNSIPKDERKPLLFCVDDSAVAMAQYLDDVPICPVGFWTDEHLVREIDTVVGRAKPYIERMREKQPEGPYRLVGFCGAALSAFEMARQLREQGEEVRLLVLGEPAQIGFALAAPTRSLWATLRYYRVRLQIHLARLVRTPVRSWPRYVYERMLGVLHTIAIKLKLARSPIEASIFWNERPIVLRAFGTYVPGRYPGKATFFLASQTVALRQPTDFDWNSVVEGGIDLHIIPGDHDSILGPEVRTIAEAIRALYHESIDDFEGAENK